MRTAAPKGRIARSSFRWTAVISPPPTNRPSLATAGHGTPSRKTTPMCVGSWRRRCHPVSKGNCPIWQCWSKGRDFELYRTYACMETPQKSRTTKLKSFIRCFCLVFFLHKLILHLKLLGVLWVGLAIAGISQSALAAGTLQGTTISNSASVDYKVNSISQTTVTSSAVTFKVDRKVIFAVATAEVAAVSVTPGSSGNVLRFTVTNTSNDTLDFDLAAVALSGTAAKFTGTDNIDASAAPSVFVDANGNDSNDSGTDTGTSINNHAPGSAISVFVGASVATGLSNGDIASYHLKATAKASDGSALSDDSGSVDVAGTVQNVFADAAGTATATNVVVSDSLVTEIGNGTIAFKTDGYAAGKGIQVTAPNLHAGAATALTNATDGDEGDFGATAANTVTVTGIS